MAYTTIDDPSAFFQCSLYAGNAGTQTITHGGNSDLQADMVWLKGRNHAESTFVTDSVRGVNAQLYTNGTNAEGTETNVVTGFGSDSIAIGNYSDTNSSNKIYVSWNWKESADAGFDIVAYTGSGSAKTVAHNLGVKPDVIICKSRSGAEEWRPYFSALGATFGMRFNDTNAKDDDAGYWNDVEPTSSVFTVGTNAGTNGDGVTFIAYCFSAKQGYSHFGSYTGNANADGPFIYTGFKPAFFIYKSSTTGGEEWKILDNKRDPINRGSQRNLNVHTNTAESDDANSIGEFVSNGVKIRSAHNNINKSGDKFIYLAFAENPLVTSKGIPATAR